MPVDPNQVLAALRRVKGPDLQSNIVDLGLVSEIRAKDDKVFFSITIPAHRAEELEQLRKAAEKVASDVPGVVSATVVLTAEGGGGPRPPAPQPLRRPTADAPRAEHSRVREARAKGSMGDGAGPRSAAEGAGRPQTPQAVPGVKHIIAVASGKGGVGKSTVATNLALGLKAIGLKVGIVDADIYGPSQPRLLGIAGKPTVSEGKVIKPMEGYGLKVMSMGFLVDEGTPVVWRGPMVVSALTQMLRETDWAGTTGELDALIVDMPPGTGDVQLTISQNAPLSGAVIVSTPQDLALIDARKGIGMFKRVEVPILGVIENMSYFLCPKCGERSDVFGHGGARAEAEKLGVPFLGEVPLHMDIRAASDEGRPIAATTPESVHAGVFREIAARAWAEMERAKGALTPPPVLSSHQRREVAQCCVSGWPRVRILSRDAARHEPVSGGARPFAGSAHHRWPQEKRKDHRAEAGWKLRHTDRVRRWSQYGPFYVGLSASAWPREGAALGRVSEGACYGGGNARLARRLVRRLRQTASSATWSDARPNRLAPRDLIG